MCMKLSEEVPKWLVNLVPVSAWDGLSDLIDGIRSCCLVSEIILPLLSGGVCTGYHTLVSLRDRGSKVLVGNAL